MNKDMFQSQTRSRSTCDSIHKGGPARHFLFQSQTRSRSTCDLVVTPPVLFNLYVSISDEKPLHMRLTLPKGTLRVKISFNLRREAAPHATTLYLLTECCRHSFNLRREAAPHATLGIF